MKRILLKCVVLGPALTVKPSPKSKPTFHPLWPDAKTLGEILDPDVPADREAINRMVKGWQAFTASRSQSKPIAEDKPC